MHLHINAFRWLSSRGITLIFITSFIWARQLLAHKKKCTAHSGMSQTHGSGDSSCHSWVTGDVVNRSSVILHMWPDPGHSFSTSLTLHLSHHDRLPYGESLAMNTDALPEHCLSLPPLSSTSVSFFPICHYLSAFTDSSISMYSADGGQVMHVLSWCLSKEEVQE